MKTELRESRRQHVLSAACRVFAAKGYRAASIADIIKEADIARGTFYLYYESKLDVFKAIMDRFLGDLRMLAAHEKLRTAPADSVPQTIRDIVINSLRYFSANRDLASVLFRHGASVDPDYKDKCKEALGTAYGLWERRIQEHQAMGITNPALDPTFLRVSLIGMFGQVILDYVVRDESRDLDRLADQFMEFVTNGIFRNQDAGGKGS